jgi:methionyl-tRNA formyltransferase
MNPGLRVLFCGTPQFAVPSLESIVTSRHRVAAVVTVPDRPQGRGQKPAFSAVKSRALTWGFDRPTGGRMR